MRPGALIDTGAIVAIIAADEPWHAACLEALPSIEMPLLTTEAVLAEFFHLISARNLNMDRAWNFVCSGALSVQPIADTELPELRALMARYHDRPMDFADATLVHIANRESVSLILTIDHDDFETYRLAGNKRFTIRPHRLRT
jgi:predicted nucleic acid-binding protein